MLACLALPVFPAKEFQESRCFLSYSQSFLALLELTSKESNTDCGECDQYKRQKPGLPLPEKHLRPHKIAVDEWLLAQHNMYETDGIENLAASKSERQ